LLVTRSVVVVLDVLRAAAYPAQNAIDPHYAGERGPCQRTGRREAVYIGVGTIVAILVIVLLIAFVF
jgi:hypothetical protein